MSPASKRASQTSTTRSARATTCRVIAADDIQGALGAHWAFESKGVGSAYVLDDQSLYGHGVAQVFNDTLVELGGEVLGFEGYDPKAPDYQALMTKIADAAPDLVYVGATVENNPSKVLLDMRSLMPADEVIFLGPDGLFTQAFIDGAGDAAEGAFLTFAGLPTNRAGGTWRRLRHPDERDPRPRAGRLFDLLLRLHGRRHPGDRSGRREGSRQDPRRPDGTENFTSLVGKTWSFTETGDTDTPTMSVNEIKPNDEGELAITFLEVIGD